MFFPRLRFSTIFRECEFCVLHSSRKAGGGQEKKLATGDASVKSSLMVEIVAFLCCVMSLSRHVLTLKLNECADLVISLSRVTGLADG